MSNGPASPVKGTDKVKIEYTLESDQDTWTQTVRNADTGAALSSFQHKSGPYMRGYGTGTGCNLNCKGSTSAQTYTNTVITLKSADPNFRKTIGTSHGAMYTRLTSSEGGKVWTTASNQIPAMIWELGVWMQKWMLSSLKYILISLYIAAVNANNFLHFFAPEYT